LQETTTKQPPQLHNRELTQEEIDRLKAKRTRTVYRKGNSAWMDGLGYALGTFDDDDDDDGDDDVDDDDDDNDDAIVLLPG
jgi:hypothetical protein